MIRSLQALLLLACLGLGGAAAAADEMVGRYTADGTTPQGKSYAGDVQIEQLGALHVVLWKLQGSEAYKGVGIRQGDVLGAAYGGPDTKFGLVVYKINGGTLEGRWVDSRDLKSELGLETLQGSADLSGTYKITLGQNRDGMTNYSGEVTITRNGDAYLFYWPAKPPVIGVGVRVKDTLVVAYSANPKKLPGVVAYQFDGKDALTGIWATAGIKQTATGTWQIAAPSKTGSELLKRQP